MQNWIGPEGSEIEDARHVPPPPEKLDEKLSELEQFLQDPAPGIPVIIQCALIHYQFEVVHPFADGIGRSWSFVNTINFSRKKFARQAFTLSVFTLKETEQNIIIIYKVCQNSTWTEWIRFFLRGVIEQASDAINNVRKLTDLRTGMKQN